MADATPRRLDPLLVFTLASFHTTLFTLVPLLGLHWSEALGDLLGGLSTTVGLGLFVLLWATTWWTNRRLLAVVPFDRAHAWPVLKGALRWGGVTGSLFFGELAVVALLQAAAVGQLGPPDLESIPILLFVFTLGTLVAFVVGGLAATVLTGIDLLALRVVDAIVLVQSDQSPAEGG